MLLHLFKQKLHKGYRHLYKEEGYDWVRYYDITNKDRNNVGRFRKSADSADVKKNKLGLMDWSILKIFIRHMNQNQKV